MCPEKKKNFKWAESLNSNTLRLGVRFCTDQNEGMKMNYEDKVRKVEDILYNCQKKEINASCITIGLHYVFITYMFLNVKRN